MTWVGELYEDLDVTQRLWWAILLGDLGGAIFVSDLGE